jgi:hypothetical protein
MIQQEKKMTTNLETQGGMHIDSDPKTGAIAASNAVAAEEAINKGKNDQPQQTEKAEQDQPQEYVDPRKAIMEKIYENRSEQFKKELEYAAAIDSGATVEPIVEDQPEEKAQEEVEEKPAPIKVEKKQEQVSQPAKKQVVVNGQTYELTEAEIEHLAQRAIYNEGQQRQQVQPQQQYQQPQPQVQQVQPELDREQLKEIARKITYGSEDESTKALGDLVGLTANLAARNTVDPNQIVQATTQNVLAHVQFQDNLKTIASEYTDVFNDSDKTFIAARKVGELRQKNAMLGVQASDLDLYREACRATREKFRSAPETASIVDKKQSAAQPVVTQVNSNRVERKRAAPSTPAAVNRTQAMDQQRGAATGSDIVNAMRKSRGQPSA